MIISSPRTLRMFRSMGRCEWCGRACKKREAAHVFATGLGGGHRLDIRINLLGLGRGAWAGRAECDCHARHHDGRVPRRSDLLKVVAKREGLAVPDLRAAIQFIDRLDGKLSRDRIEDAIDVGCNWLVSAIVRVTLQEHRKL